MIARGKRGSQPIGPDQASSHTVSVGATPSRAGSSASRHAGSSDGGIVFPTGALLLPLTDDIIQKQRRNGELQQQQVTADVSECSY